MNGMLTIHRSQPLSNSQIPTADFLSSYEELLDQRHVQAKAKPYFLRWAKTWFTTVDADTPSSTMEFFQTLGRRPNIPPWQFQQAVRAVSWLTRDILQIPWATSFDWRGLADQAKPLEDTHRTHGREATPVFAKILSPASPSSPLPETEAEVCRVCDDIRRAIRLGGLSYATEETYVHWNARFTRFCLMRLKQTPQNAGTEAITRYLNYLALERNVSAATQKQALNAMVFLAPKAFGNAEFSLEKAIAGHTQRRPPIVVTRDEVQSIFCLSRRPMETRRATHVWLRPSTDGDPPLARQRH